MKKRRFLYWFPRIAAILFICFLALFSLDIFGNGYTFWQTVLGLFMHNIPVLILAAVLAIGWKREWLPGIVFILGGFAYIVMLFRNPQFEWYMISWSLTIAAPAFLIGIMFLINWKIRRKLKK